MEKATPRRARKHKPVAGPHAMHTHAPTFVLIIGVAAASLLVQLAALVGWLTLFASAACECARVMEVRGPALASARGAVGSHAGYPHFFYSSGASCPRWDALIQNMNRRTVSGIFYFVLL